GGTMLYFKALREGLSALPAADPALRAVIDARAQTSGWPALHAELARLDPLTAARLKPTDAQRIQRALEVCTLTGKPMSQVLGRSEIAVLPYRVISIGLAPENRAVLHERIAQRFENILKNGLIAEVQALRARYDLNPSLPSMRCVGYRQVWQYLEAEFSRDELQEKGVAATRQLAKRQLTWLRAMNGVQTFDCLAANLPQRVETYLEQAMTEHA
ncbi:MAG: tRNA (adenosine(37)-N6)-dimethylallyltransferase MiaA, partial [Burkholderiales bacterium]